MNGISRSDSKRRSMAPIPKPAIAGGPPPFPSSRNSLASTLQRTQLLSPVTPILPVEIIAAIIDHLPIPDLMRAAQTSKKLKEMVYDDTRWVGKLNAMGVWNEAEARKRFDDAMKRKKLLQQAKAEEEERNRIAAGGASGRGGGVAQGSTIFDAGEEGKPRNRDSRIASGRPPSSVATGMDLLSLGSAPSTPKSAIAGTHPPPLDGQRSNSALTVLGTVRSARGFARQEYGRVYAALGPLYFDLVRARTHADPVIFRRYRNPEDQAAILAQLRTFEKSDTAYGWSERANRLDGMTNIFENAALREFEGGYEAEDFDGRMKRYAGVLITLNGGQACIQTFIQKHYLMFERERLGNPMDCFSDAGAAVLSLDPAKEFFARLTQAINEQTGVIDRVFPPTVNVLLPFMDRVAEDVIGEYLTPVLDEAHDRDIESYLKSVAGLYFETVKFSGTIRPSAGSGPEFISDLEKLVTKVFEPHVDLYLSEELDHFRKDCENEVANWEKKITDEYAATETFYMSNINRQADKQDFLTSFKKVILAPVNAVNAIPIHAANFSFPGVRFGAPAAPVVEAEKPKPVENPFAESLEVPDGIGGFSGSEKTDGTSTPLPAPTSELAAKAAILNTRMEGIRSLFNIELALDLVHKAKNSIERAALFVKFGGQTGEEAKEQCESIFIALLQSVGQRHVKSGFDKAVQHLSQYNPREIGSSKEDELVVVQPLVQFLELVNVGDLIQQMVDVFYEQELVASKLSDRNDFLNPAIQEKKKFESMLDERVAAGLNTGIDVLMNEVDYIFAKTQKLTDFNPGALGDNATPDIGPSSTAVKVVELVSSHTKLLVGSTDKNVLDVFNQEVGMRLFGSLCKHIKRQRISVDGAIMLISDVNLFHHYILTLRNASLLQYFNALRELAQIYLIDPQHAKQMATVIADGARFKGIFRVEEVYEFVTRRSDWYQVKKDVEGAMYGFGCAVM